MTLHGLPRAQPADLGLRPTRLARLMDALREDVARGRLPGAAVLLARRGHVALLDTVGRLDPAREAPMRPDAIFRIYSMTKPVVSVAAMMLAEDGRLALAQPISAWLPGFAALPPITVHDLLRHTAGMTYEFLGDHPVQQAYRAARIGSRERRNAAFAEAMAGLPLLVPPGTQWTYSRATDVLGALLEAVSGQTLGALLRERVFEPLGMHDTAFSVPADQATRLAQPFDHDPDGGVVMRLFDPLEAPAMEVGGGGLMSTLADYARFLQCLRQGGTLDGVRLLGPRTVRFMMSDHLGDIRPAPGDPLLPPGHGFGLGFAVRTAPGLAAVPGSVGTCHWSGIGGTSFFIDPAADFYGIFLAQAPNQREHYRALFRTMAYAALRD